MKKSDACFAGYQISIAVQQLKKDIWYKAEGHQSKAKYIISPYISLGSKDILWSKTLLNSIYQMHTVYLCITDILWSNKGEPLKSHL